MRGSVRGTRRNKAAGDGKAKAKSSSSTSVAWYDSMPPGVYFGHGSAPHTIDFPATAPGGTSKLAVLLANTSRHSLIATVRVSSGGGGGGDGAGGPPFAVRHGSVRLRPRSFVMLPVRFRPTHVGLRTGVVTATAQLAPAPPPAAPEKTWVKVGGRRRAQARGHDAAAQRAALEAARADEAARAAAVAREGCVLTAALQVVGEGMTQTAMRANGLMS